jgi:hypothetical protein
MGTGAVSRYKVVSNAEISQGAVVKLSATVRVWVQRQYEFVLVAGTKAKTVTNNLPILSVLAKVMLVL